MGVLGVPALSGLLSLPQRSPQSFLATSCLYLLKLSSSSPSTVYMKFFVSLKKSKFVVPHGPRVSNPGLSETGRWPEIVHQVTGPNRSSIAWTELTVLPQPSAKSDSAAFTAIATATATATAWSMFGRCCPLALLKLRHRVDLLI